MPANIPGQSAFVSALNDHPTPFPTTDLAAGRFIAALSRTDDHWICYRATSPTRGEWYVWNGKVHALDLDNVDDTLVTTFLDALKEFIDLQKTANQPTESQLKMWNQKAQQWSSGNGIETLKRRVREHLRVPMDYFDQEIRYIAMADGRVLDLGMLDAKPLDPDPHRPVTRCLGVSIIEGVKTDPCKWQGWLDQMIPIKEEQKFLQVTAGAALVGDGKAKIIVHFVGPPDSGKTFYMNVVSTVFGDYAGHLSSTAIIAKYGGGTNYAQSSAKGVRFLTLSEPSTQKTDDSFLKSISGSRDPIRTEKKGQNEESWYAQCVLHIAANHTVKFNTSDAAIVERINIIEMHALAPNEINELLEMEIIDEEADGILQWVIDGAKIYMDEGITVPETVKARAQDNVVEASGPLRWLADRIAAGKYEVDPEALKLQFVERSEAYNDFKIWCEENGERYVSNHNWRAEVNARTGLKPGAKEPKSDGTIRLYGVVHGQGNPVPAVYPEGQSVTDEF